MLSVLIPLFELRERRDALSGGIGWDGLRRGLQYFVPGCERLEVVQLPLDGRRAGEGFDESQGGVREAVDALARVLFLLNFT